MSEKTLYLIKVVLEDAPDGWLRAYSDDLSGLILSGPDRNEICDSIKPAIEMLLVAQGFKNIVFREVKPIRLALKEPSPRIVDVSLHYEQYAVELEAA